MAIVTVIGLYNYDNTIFDNLSVPDGLDAETCRNRILFECGELELLYYEPDVFSSQLDNWCAINSYEWGRIYEALRMDYSPIENYDRTEEWQTTTSGTSGNTSGGTSSNRGTDETVVSQSGYNSTAFQPAQKSVNTPNTTYTTDAHSDTETSGSETRTGRAHGNIGITTNVDMLNQEMEFRAKYNMYSIITKSFKKEFCLQIY